jgi:hypothetical protein
MRMKTFKTLGEYYDFFEAIPEEKWGVGEYYNNKGQCCALGHLGVRESFFETYLPKVNKQFQIPVEHLLYNAVIPSINDGIGIAKNLGDTPKQRVLNAILLKSAGVFEEEKP